MLEPRIFNRFCFTVLFCLFFSAISAAQSIRYYYSMDSDVPYFFEFNGNEISIYDWPSTDHPAIGRSTSVPGYNDYLAYLISGKYSIKRKGLFKELIINEKPYIMLALGNEICILIESDIEMPYRKRMYWGVNERYLLDIFKRSCGLYSPEWPKLIRTSDGLKSYDGISIPLFPPFNIPRYGGIWLVKANSTESNPWIELAAGNNVDKIVVINGVVLPGSIDQYKQFDRAKNIIIRYDNIEQNELLRDDPNPQVIYLSKCIDKTTKVMINIVDTYQGDERRILGISYIGFMSSLVLVK